MIETYRGIVYPGHLDHMAHMNVQWYASKFDEATWQLMGMVGVTPSYIREQQKGMAALEQKTTYVAEVVAGDLLVVKSKILKVEAKTIHFMHKMYNLESELEVASTELLGVHIDRVKRKSEVLPDYIREACRAYL